ncbi:hypothetical protein D3C77_556880 [compost metagenome]
MRLHGGPAINQRGEECSWQLGAALELGLVAEDAECFLFHPIQPSTRENEGFAVGLRGSVVLTDAQGQPRVPAFAWRASGKQAGAYRHRAVEGVLRVAHDNLKAIAAEGFGLGVKMRAEFAEQGLQPSDECIGITHRA